MTEVKTISKKRKIIRAMIFVIITALLLMYLNQVFTIAASDSNKRIFNAFYQEEENTIDAVYLGTSASNRYFIGPMAYEQEGMAVFTLATMGMPMFFMPILMDEIEKTQNPQMYIIELRWVLKDKDMITDAHIRRVTDSMKPSSNRTAAIKKALEFTEGSSQELGELDDPLAYYFPIIKYHSRLEMGNLTVGEMMLLKDANDTKGYVLSPKTTVQKPYKGAEYTDKRSDMSPEAEATLVELLDCCDGLDQDVLFVMSPYNVKEKDAAVFNTAMDMVRERGYTVVDFNKPEMIEKLGIDWEKDFYNSKHVNFLGAEKYTEYLAEYLADNYDLPDRRGDEKYESWHEAYESYQDFVSKGITK